MFIKKLILMVLFYSLLFPAFSFMELNKPISEEPIKLNDSIKVSFVSVKIKETKKQKITSNKSKKSEEKLKSKEKITSVKKSGGWKNLGVFTIVHYCPCAKCCGRVGQKTASGTRPKAGRTIAVDRRVIPLGSKVIIGNKEYVAEDVGGGIKGNKIDVFVNSHSEALKRGKKRLNVKVSIN